MVSTKRMLAALLIFWNLFLHQVSGIAHFVQKVFPELAADEYFIDDHDRFHLTRINTLTKLDLINMDTYLNSIIVQTIGLKLKNCIQVVQLL